MVGFLGLGAMGRPMASNLARAGHRVLAWNRSPIDPPPGAELAESPREVSERTGASFVMVSDAAAVEEVVFGPGGWAEGAGPGSVLIQSSTIGPEATRAIGSRLEAAGVRMLDAPVSGSVKPAEEAKLTILGGGDPSLFERHQGLFEAIAARTVVFGPVGSGAAVKLAVNGLLVSVIAAAAEGLSWLIEVEPDLEVAAYASVIERISPIAAARAESIAGEAQEGGFSLRQAAKDMELVADAFGGDGIMGAVRAVTRSGLEQGFGDLDIACLGTVVRRSRAKSPAT